MPGPMLRAIDPTPNSADGIKNHIRKKAVNGHENEDIKQHIAKI